MIAPMRRKCKTAMPLLSSARIIATFACENLQHNGSACMSRRGETLGNVVLASGGIPLAIPNSLQYFAYDHQKVDIGMTTIADVKTKKIWEVMDTISLTNNANMQFLMIANSSWWNSLNPNLRKFISRAALTTEEKSVENLLYEYSISLSIEPSVSLLMIFFILKPPPYLF